MEELRIFFFSYKCLCYGSVVLLSKKNQGIQLANAAKKTLLAELNEIELRMNELVNSSFKDLILLTLRKLEVSLEEINIHIDYVGCPLNSILQEYFMGAREKLRSQLIEINN